MKSFLRAIPKTGTFLLNIVLPPLCLGCRQLVEQNGSLCGICWGSLTFLSAPWCKTCGLPFELEAEEANDILCGACLAEPPPYHTARAALVYDGGSRGLILAFKHGDKTEAAPTYSRWMARVGEKMLAQADWVTPVPLHPWRLFRRRYNQAGLLAKAVAPRGRFSADMLRRRRMTKSQGTFSRNERFRNVAGVFSVRPWWLKRVKGANIVLVDDVLTTGATVLECTRVLKKAGAARVDVLTLARVV